MNIYANDKLVVEGNLNAFTNPAIEAGLMHCRVLLEFLGLCMTSDGRLRNIKKRRGTDIGIEHFQTDSGPLPKVAPDDALNRYPGSREEAENALLAVFQITNKGLAHVTAFRYSTRFQAVQHRLCLQIQTKLHRGSEPLSTPSETAGKSLLLPRSLTMFRSTAPLDLSLST